MSRRVVAFLLCLLGVLAAAAPASAHWTAGGTGSGAATTAAMPSGATPSVSANGRTVTVTFAQNAFASSTIGSLGGSYTLKRYAEGSTIAITPAAGCGTTFTGAQPAFSCVEANVPYGRWEYQVTPALATFTGDEGPSSTVVVVELAAPVLAPVVAGNPAVGATDGPIAVTWSAVADATGYDVFRRTSGGSYPTTPLNGATPLTATSFADTTATGGATYDYVVRAVTGPPAVVSRNSDERTAKVVTRPAVPAGAVTATPAGGGAVTVAWSAVPAADGYNVYRRTNAGAFDDATPLNGATPVTVASFVDATAASGTSYRYVVRALVVGAGGTQVLSARSAESAAASCSSSYLARITASAPTTLYRLGEATGTAAINTGSTTRSGVYGGGFTLGAAGAIGCDPSTAVTFNGTSGYLGAVNAARVAGPNAFTTHAWFKTTVGGGKIIGFGDARTGTSTNTDRHVYMTDAGNLVFGVFSGSNRTIVSPLAYADGKWHMVTASLGAAGMRLFVDGAQVAADAAVTTGRGGNGFWRAAYDNLNGWAQRPGNSYFTGTLDEIAIFGSQLPASTIAAHHSGNSASTSCASYSRTTAAATADTWLNQSSPATGNPTDSVLKVTSKNGNSNTRALVQTPLPGAVPAGCALISARLRLWNKSPVSGRTLTAQPNAAAWNAATGWTAQPAVTGTASTAVAPAAEGFMEWDVLTQVQGMLAGGTNYGFSVRDSVEGSAAGPEQQFESVEGSAGRRPELVYEFG